MNAAAAVLCLALLGASGVDNFGSESNYDLLEVNHYYDENGAHLLDQILFYDYDMRSAKYLCEGWRLIKESSQYPHRDSKSGKWMTSRREGAQYVVITASKFRETWTQYDPELLARRDLPRELRLELKALQTQEELNELAKKRREFGIGPRRADLPPVPEGGDPLLPAPPQPNP